MLFKDKAIRKRMPLFFNEVIPSAGQQWDFMVNHILEQGKGQYLLTI
jgi:hypothetical protein